MARHIHIERMPSGRFGIFGKRGNLITDHATEAEAVRAITPGMQNVPARTAAEIQESHNARQAELVRRLAAGLSLTRADAAEARRVIRRGTNK